MKVTKLKFCAFLLIFLNIQQICYSVPIKNPTKSLTVNYAVLTEDVKWLFRGISTLADTVEKMLPNITVNDINSRSFSENTKLTFLTGLRHLLVGIREISMTFEENFNTDHIKQLQQLKNATNFVNEILIALKMWFTQMRIVVVHLVNLYNRYIPEVLFGKCVGNYLITTYPDRSYYEYPFILVAELYTSIVSRISVASAVEKSTESVILDNDSNVEQNEILHSDSDRYPTSSYGIKSSSQLDEENASNAENIFDLSLVLNENKDKIIESAGNQQSWQICLKLYTAESISRSLKSYFLGL